MSTLSPPGTPVLNQEQFLALHRIWVEAGPAPIIAAIETMNRYRDEFLPGTPSNATTFERLD